MDLIAAYWWIGAMSGKGQVNPWVVVAVPWWRQPASLGAAATAATATLETAFAVALNWATFKINIFVLTKNG